MFVCLTQNIMHLVRRPAAGCSIGDVLFNDPETAAFYKLQLLFYDIHIIGIHWGKNIQANDLLV